MGQKKQILPQFGSKKGHFNLKLLISVDEPITFDLLASIWVKKIEI